MIQEVNCFKKIYFNGNGKIRLWVSLIFLVLNSSLFSQQNNLIYKQITSADGLQDDNVRAIEQDDQGYMWFGTRSGLTRYDGINFKSFTYDPYQPDGLSGNDVSGLHKDKNGNLWIGTINGLCRFDKQLDRPLKIPIRIGNKILSPAISDITSDNNGLVWFSTLGDGIISYNPSSNEFAQYSQESNPSNGLLSNTIFRILCTADNMIWIGTAKGLNSFDQKSKTFKYYTHNRNIPNSISDNSIRSLCEGENGDLWIGTINGGLNRLNRKSGKITVYKHDPDNQYTLNDNDVTAILYARDGTVWVGSGSGTEALNKLDVETGKVTRYKISEYRKGAYIIGTIYDIIEDRTGIIWLSQILGGINYFDPNWKNYEHYLVDTKNTENRLNAIYGILPVSGKQIWASTADGLILFDREEGLIKKYGNISDNYWLNGNSSSSYSPSNDRW